MTDIWACSNCSSINRQRANRCYKCGADREVAATGDMDDLRVSEAVAQRTVQRYRGSTLRFMIAALLIVAVAAVGIVILLESLRDVDQVRNAFLATITGDTTDDAALTASAERLGGAQMLHLGLIVAAVAAFGAWLSRVISNIPTLGGGLPATSPTRAFIYPFIPLWNLFKVPGIIQDAMYRLDPKSGGFFMVAIAWFGLVGSWLVNFVGGWIITYIAMRDLGTAVAEGSRVGILQVAGETFDRLILLNVITSSMVAAGAVMLVLVMARIERRARDRDADVRAALMASGFTSAHHADQVSAEA